MKDKIKPIDLSIISSYMGRSLTGAIALFVIAVAVSSLFSGGGPQRNIIDVCVFDSRTVWPRDAYAPFRMLLSGEARRPVVLHVCEENWDREYDLYILPTGVYLQYSARLGIEALYEVRHTQRPRDSAILVARPTDENVDFASMSPADVAFSTRSSINGFLIQLSILAERGFKMPAAVDQFRFEGGAGDESRVILGVLYGAYRLGACRLSDLSSLTERGVIRAGELTVVDRAEALPEIVIAAPSGEATYYRRRLKHIDALLDEITAPGDQNGSVRLLKSYGIKGLEPVDEGRIEKTRRLFEQYADRLTRASH
jgi:ABC-type phosphate/phosphonate transport system substrate-binding protein